MELRKVLATELDKIMEKNSKIAIVNADLAKAHANMDLQKKYPDRAFNVGVAEQNMASVAAGLSAYGFTPFVYSFASFASRRMCDQISLSISHSKLNVKIVGSEPGITAEVLGATHSALDDISVLRAIPNMVIYEPVDEIQLKQAIPQIIDHYGPVYIRLVRKETPNIFDENYKFDLFKADILNEGKDITIFATGIMVEEALKAVELLKEEGIEAELINVHTIKPLDKDTILKSVKKTGCAVTCENHSTIGGLKSAISELLVSEYPISVEGIGTGDHFSEVGPKNYLKEKFGLTAKDIVNLSKKVIEKK